MSEVENIKQRYERRKHHTETASSAAFFFEWFHRKEKELKFARILRRRFGSDFSSLKLMEVGAGTGNNLYFFAQQGFELNNIWANELLDDRFEVLRRRFPSIRIEPGDATELTHKDSFDVVLQSVVFTSILDDAFKQKMANTLFRMTKPGGMILWYDFTFNNPNNKDVKGIGKKEISILFKDAKSITFARVTLAPPIGRRVGTWYNFINALVPFLRTHTIAVITK